MVWTISAIRVVSLSVEIRINLRISSKKAMGGSYLVISLNSLFGLEYLGDGKSTRFQGYSAGRLEINENSLKLIRWPRHLRKTVSGAWEIVPYVELGGLEDEAIAENIPLPDARGQARTGP
jgi:hypothetical protein